MPDHEEVWKQVPCWEAYEVSSFGRVRSIERRVRSGNNSTHLLPQRILAPQRTPSGYLTIFLSDEAAGRRKNGRIHRLVALAFIGDPPDRSNTQINHKDGDKTNNAVENLEWCDTAHNTAHARAMGLSPPKPARARAKLSRSQAEEIIRRVAKGEAKLAVARAFNMSPFGVRSIVSGAVNLDNYPATPPKEYRNRGRSRRSQPPQGETEKT